MQIAPDVCSYEIDCTMRNPEGHDSLWIGLLLTLGRSNTEGLAYDAGV